MTSATRNILVTSALPYANAPLHLGHILEQVQADIWVRFQRSRGHQCIYVCADDAHGTAIMLAAEKAGTSPETHIERVRLNHLEDSTGFVIGFDNYASTHSPENQQWSAEIFNRLDTQGHIGSREITQAFDPDKGLFLADRFISN